MNPNLLKKNHIVVANGLGASGHPIQTILREDGYEHVSYVPGGAEVIALCKHMWVDVVLLDLSMPDMDGLEVIEQLVPVMSKGRLQVIVVADEADDSARHKALALGARDFITEPLDSEEVKLRVRNALVTSMLEAEVIARNIELAENIASRPDELGRARQEVLRHLAIAAEFRDDDTGEHTDRVARGAATLARAFGLQQDAVRLIASAAPLHDIGKIGIPDRILLKRGKLTLGERRIMQTHTQIGAAILSESEVAELKMAEAIALYHHEHWDGGGYPHGVSGVSIPLAARVVAVADVFDALVFPRPYKEAWPIADALGEIEAQSARQFDPGLVEVFLRLDHERLRSSTNTDVGAVQRRAVFDAAAQARLAEPRSRTGAGRITARVAEATRTRPSPAVE